MAKDPTACLSLLSLALALALALALFLSWGRSNGAQSNEPLGSLKVDR